MLETVWEIIKASTIGTVKIIISIFTGFFS